MESTEYPETVLRDLENLRQLHVESHEQLSLAFKKSQAVTQKLKTLLPRKGAVTPPPTAPSEIFSGVLSQRRESRISKASPNTNIKINGSRVPSVEQLELAMMLADASVRRVPSMSIESGDEGMSLHSNHARYNGENLLSIAPGGDVIPPTNIPNTLDAGAGDNRLNTATMTLAHINKGAQAQILEKWVSQDDKAQEPDDLGSKILFGMPKFLYVAMPLQALIAVASLLLSDSWHNLQVQYFSSIISKVFYIIASALCPLLLLISLRSRDVMLAVGKLNEFLADFNLEWRNVSGQHWRRSALTWLTVVVIEGINQAFFILDETSDGNFHSSQVIKLLSVMSFAICSAWVMVVAYTQCHMLAALDRSLDCWCFSMVSDPDFELGVHTWNRLQALLKCVGRGLASSFIAMQVLGAVGFVYSIASGIMVCFQFDFAADKIFREMLSSLPLLFLFTLNMTVCANGASLTEKCRNIPALVNQLPSELGIDMERQYLVNFLKDSAAGFCVKDVRVTREMLAKQFIIIGGVVSGLFAALSRAI